MMIAVAFAVAEAAGALSGALPYLDLKEEMTSVRMLWGLLFSLGEASTEEEAFTAALLAESGAAVTVVAESSICRSLRLDSCSNKRLLQVCQVI